MSLGRRRGGKKKTTINHEVEEELSNSRKDGLLSIKQENERNISKDVIERGNFEDWRL